MVKKDTVSRTSGPAKGAASKVARSATSGQYMGIHADMTPVAFRTLARKADGKLHTEVVFPGKLISDGDVLYARNIISSHAVATTHLISPHIRMGDMYPEAAAYSPPVAPGAELPPVHPGEILAEEFMAPLGLSAIAVAKLVNVPRTRIERLVAGQTSMTPDTALRLERLFGATAQFWLNLQLQHDLAYARREATDLDVIKPYNGDIARS